MPSILTLEMKTEKYRVSEPDYSRTKFELMT